VDPGTLEMVRAALLDEQRRIAAILDQADALRDKRRQALAQVEQLTQSVFLEMFGEQPDRWTRVPVSEYVERFEGGQSIVATGDQATSRGLKVLKISAVTSGEFLASEVKPIPDTHTPNQSHFVQLGDLHFSRANTADLVGAVARVKETVHDVLLPDKLWRFCWREPRTAEPTFIWHLFRTAEVRRQLAQLATGTSSSMKNISQFKLMSMQTILPPPRASARVCPPG
jgi:type I restriction enzyme S subunit